MERKVVIAGNWKMNKDAAAGRELVESLKPLKADAVDDVSVTCRANGWYGLGIIWVRSLSARGVAVKKVKKGKK